MRVHGDARVHERLDVHGEYSFAEDSGVVRANSQLLSHVAALPKVNCNIPFVRDRFALRV